MLKMFFVGALGYIAFVAHVAHLTVVPFVGH